MEELDNQELSFVEYALALILFKHQQQTEILLQYSSSFMTMGTNAYCDPQIKNLAIQIGEFMYVYKTCINPDAKVITTPEEMSHLLDSFKDKDNITVLAELDNHFTITKNFIAEKLDLSDESNDSDIQRKRNFVIVINEIYEYCSTLLKTPLIYKRNFIVIQRWLSLLSDDMM